MLMRVAVPMRARFVGVLLFCLIPLVVAPFAHAQGRGGGGGQRGPSRPGTGNPDVQLVPWKFLEKGATPVKGLVVLYWLPASRNEIERSELVSSRALIEDAARCVSMQVILPDDTATIEKLGATGKLPMALLVDADGKAVRRVDNSRGVLRADSVEQMVKDELGARDEAVYQEITEAKRRAAAGDKAAAIDLYKKVWEQRCLFPLLGSEAQHALKDLGVAVHEPPPQRQVDPYLNPAPTTAPPQQAAPDNAPRGQPAGPPTKKPASV
jgi:hypothetical protein